MIDPAFARNRISGESTEPPGDAPSSVEVVLGSYPVPESWRFHDEVVDDEVALEVRAPARVAKRPPALLPDESLPRRFPTAHAAAIALVVLVLAQTAVIARLLATVGTAAVPALKVPVTILSDGIDAVVTIDGRQVGSTPYQLDVDASVHTIRLTRRAQPLAASVPKAPTAVDRVEANGTNGLGSSAAPRRPDGRRSSPVIDSQIVTDDRAVGSVVGSVVGSAVRSVVGSSANVPVVATPGGHQVDLVNTPLGDQRTVVGDRSASVAVKPPEGRLNLNAVPWARVWIDGEPVGETPLSNIPVTAGEREIVFRHPQLGERRETATVKPGALTRVSVTLSQ
jgi:hypothetical protein